MIEGVGGHAPAPFVHCFIECPESTVSRSVGPIHAGVAARVWHPLDMPPRNGVNGTW